ncbi:hypothetical protein A3Q56_04559 [Intoshia linei]|uniref:VWFA domain-containing protein n=1 Tax=Intoshia linei TaxID=1819745 RepID=A0A177B2R1_9BILA|nr:hypothetical protein A3Q56_04559 [Intoshia linei]
MMKQIFVFKCIFYFCVSVYGVNNTKCLIEGNLFTKDISNYCNVAKFQKDCLETNFPRLCQKIKSQPTYVNSDCKMNGIMLFDIGASTIDLNGNCPKKYCNMHHIYNFSINLIKSILGKDPSPQRQLTLGYFTDKDYTFQKSTNNFNEIEKSLNENYHITNQMSTFDNFLIIAFKTLYDTKKLKQFKYSNVKPAIIVLTDNKYVYNKNITRDLSDLLSIFNFKLIVIQIQRENSYNGFENLKSFVKYYNLNKWKDVDGSLENIINDICPLATSTMSPTTKNINTIIPDNKNGSSIGSNDASKIRTYLEYRNHSTCQRGNVSLKCANAQGICPDYRNFKTSYITPQYSDCRSNIVIIHDYSGSMVNSYAYCPKKICNMNKIVKFTLSLMKTLIGEFPNNDRKITLGYFSNDYGTHGHSSNDFQYLEKLLIDKYRNNESDTDLTKLMRVIYEIISENRNSNDRFKIIVISDSNFTQYVDGQINPHDQHLRQLKNYLKQMNAEFIVIGPMTNDKIFDTAYEGLNLRENYILNGWEVPNEYIGKIKDNVCEKDNQNNIRSTEQTHMRQSTTRKYNYYPDNNNINYNNNPNENNNYPTTPNQNYPTTSSKNNNNLNQNNNNYPNNQNPNNDQNYHNNNDYSNYGYSHYNNNRGIHTKLVFLINVK